jgi:hypothetical protein
MWATGQRAPLPNSQGEKVEIGYQRPYAGKVVVSNFGGVKSMGVRGNVNCNTGGYHFESY